MGSPEAQSHQVSAPGIHIKINNAQFECLAY